VAPQVGLGRPQMILPPEKRGLCSLLKITPSRRPSGTLEQCYPL
jgi:hypothetical protein